MPAITIHDCKPQDYARIRDGHDVEVHRFVGCLTPINGGSAEYKYDFDISIYAVTHYGLHKANYTGLYLQTIDGLNQLEMWENGRRIWFIRLMREGQSKC